VNLVGTTMWTACGAMGTNTMSSTSPQVALMKHVRKGSSQYTPAFEQPQGSIAVRPQSTAPITTITYIHHFTALVIAPSYTWPTTPKVNS
jgi:hypothetical protein